MPMLIGSIPLGLAIAAFAYLVTVKTVDCIQERRRLRIRPD